MLSGNLGRISCVETESGPQWVLHEIPKMHWQIFSDGSLCGFITHTLWPDALRIRRI